MKNKLLEINLNETTEYDEAIEVNDKDIDFIIEMES